MFVQVLVIYEIKCDNLWLLKIIIFNGTMASIVFLLRVVNILFI
jgi:hypothetical protein